MSNEETQVQHTQHAFLVAWGWFGEHIGLIEAIQKVHLHQKRYTYTPQTKVLEFFVQVFGNAQKWTNATAPSP